MLYHYLTYPKLKSGGLIHGRYQCLHRFLALLLVLFRGFSIKSIIISSVIRFIICILDFIGCWYYFASQSMRLEGFEIGSCLVGVWAFAVDILRCSKCDDTICFGVLIGGSVILLIIGFQIPKYRLKKLYDKLDRSRTLEIISKINSGVNNDLSLSRRCSSRSSIHKQTFSTSKSKNIIMMGLKKPFTRVYGPYRLAKHLYEEYDENKSREETKIIDINACRQFLVLNIPMFAYNSCFWMYYLCFCEEYASDKSIINSLKLVSNASSLDMRYYIYQLLIIAQYPKETPRDRIKLMEMNRTLREARIHHKVYNYYILLFIGSNKMYW